MPGLPVFVMSVGMTTAGSLARVDSVLSTIAHNENRLYTKLRNLYVYYKQLITHSAILVPGAPVLMKVGSIPIKQLNNDKLSI